MGVIVNGDEYQLARSQQAQAIRCNEFDGDKIEISGLQADIDIRVSDSNRIVVLLTGPKAVLDSLNIDEDAGTVFVPGPRTVTVGRGGLDYELTLQVRAPLGTGVRICGIVDEVSVIDLDGDLTLDLVGPSRVSATKVNNLDIKASGETDITVDSIRGDAAIRLTGSSQVNLKQGTTGQLQIMTLDSCRVDAQVTAQNADLDAFDASAIQVKEVLGHCVHTFSDTGLVSFG